MSLVGQYSQDTQVHPLLDIKDANGISAVRCLQVFLQANSHSLCSLSSLGLVLPLDIPVQVESGDDGKSVM